MGIPVERYLRTPPFGGKKSPLIYHLRREYGSNKVIIIREKVRFSADKALNLVNKKPPNRVTKKTV